MGKEQSQILAFRGLAYLFLLLLISFFSDYVVLEGASFSLSEIYWAFAIVALGQVLATKAALNQWGFWAFFVADSVLAMLLVLCSGGSASPFLVLFPLIGLAGAVVFTQGILSWSLVGVLLVVMSLSVGFGIAILGNAFAIISTSTLGFYLAKALKLSGLQLEKSEGARRRLENLQKAILTNIPSGLLSVDADGRIIQVNRVGLSILGRQEVAIINRSLSEILPGLKDEVMRLNTLHPSSNYLESTQDRKTVDYENAKGESLKLGYSVARLSDPEDRRMLGTLVVFQDLTDIMRLEEAVRVSEKLAAVGKLAAGIAHEIRNPLAGISGSAQLLLGSNELTDEDKKLLSIIQRESVRLDGLITEFLEYVRPQKPKLENVSLSALVTQAVDNVRVSAKWLALGCNVQVDNPPGKDVRVRADANRVTQILLNFIYNAGQAKAKNLKLQITDGPRPTLKIIDDGSGISSENQKRLFEPFFTTKEGGTGLGLAISYRIIESFQASVKVVSPVTRDSTNGGSMFIIEFEGAK
jgi:two-component system sensor histidine kinase PilS (NtrC family)